MDNRRENHHRQSIRLPHYNYSQSGAYFITIVTWQHACLFGEVCDSIMRFCELGRIVDRAWREIADHFPGVKVEDYVVMPNHVHGVICIDMDHFGSCEAVETVDARHNVGASHDIAGVDNIRNVGARHASPLRGDNPIFPHGVQPKSLGAIIGSFKSAATKQIHHIPGYETIRVWQRNYYERVIRNDLEHEQIVDYIHANPANWEMDSEFRQSG